MWLLAALLIHDGMLSPAVVGLASLLRRFVPDRGRRYLQAALLMGALVTVVALPMIYLRGSQPPVKALLLRNYGLNLTLMLSLIAAITLSLYAARVARTPRSQTIEGTSTSRADRTSQRRSCSTNLDTDIRSGQPVDQVDE